MLAFFVALHSVIPLNAQDTLRLSINPNIRVIDDAPEMHADLILGNEHKFEGEVSFATDSSMLYCKGCKYFFQTGQIGIDLAEVDLEMNTLSNTATLFYRKSYTETYVIPNKLKLQIIEMDFDIRNDQPALMNPLVTDKYMIFERSQLIYYNSFSDTTAWLTNRVKINLKNGDVTLEGVELFKPFGCEIISDNREIIMDKKGNLYSLKNAQLRFPMYGELHTISSSKVKFKKQSTWFKASGIIEKEGVKYKVKNIYPEKIGNLYQITGTIKGN